MSQNYGVDSLQVKGDLQHIRERYGMYIGENDSPKHLFAEALDNAKDECQNGYASVVRVTVDTVNKEYSVYDEGRGIPIGLVKYEYNGIPIEMEALKLMVTVAKSGGKFDNNSYKIRGGLHGLGTCCITALSEYVTFQTRRDGKTVTVNAKNGEFDSLEYGETDLPNGVSVKFKGDPKIFESIDIDLNYIIESCNIAHAFGYPIELVVDGKNVELDANTLFDLLPKEDDLSTYHTIELECPIETGEYFKVAIRYTSDITSKMYGYTNLIPNKSGGTHVKVIESAIEEAWQEFASESEVDLRSYDFRLGVRGLVAAFISDPAFSSQTKDKLSVSKKSLQPFKDAFVEQFRKHLTDNPEVRRALLKRFAEYRSAQNNLLARKEIMSLIKVNEPTDSNRVRRRSVVNCLWECKSSSKEGTQLYIVEGNSAAGGLSRARDRNTQAILPLRGKIKNVTNLSIQSALQSETIRNIINAIGSGVGPEADPRRSRYEEILIACDADPDGAHITALNISVCVNLLPELVKSGMVKVVHAPLYGYGPENDRVYTNDFESIPEHLRASKGFTRYKGLGEMDDSEVKDTLLNKKKQIVTTIEYPSDLDRFNAILGTSWGKADLLKELGVIRYA